MNIIKNIFLQIFNLVIAQKCWYASKNRQKAKIKIPKTVKTNSRKKKIIKMD